MKLLIVASLLSALLLPCCKKQNAPENREAFLASGNWHIIAHKLSTSTGTTDVYANNPACRNDDYYIFNIDGSMEINEGNSKCISSAPQSQVSQWTFPNANWTKLIMNGEAYSYRKLDDNRFEIVTWYIDPYASQHTITFRRL